MNVAKPLLMKRFRKLALIATPFAALLLVFSLDAKTPPEGVQPVSDFELERYLGQWYELARTDNRFERDLSNVTATYSWKDDGNSIRVYNRGYNEKKERWDDVDGKAYPIGEEGQGSLKVTFFWPFYAGYHVFELDQENYSYALVSGDNHSYLWLLSRTPTLPQETINELMRRAEEAGFDTSELIWVEHDRENR